MENYLPFVEMYVFTNLVFAVFLSSAAPFAAKNGLSINVYDVEDGKRGIFTLHVSDNIVDGRHVDLLLHEMGGIQHYYTIRNFSRLISGQISNGAVYCCRKCLHAYSRPAFPNNHSKRFSHIQRTKFPKDPRCRFTNTQKHLPAPFVVYADFESVLVPLSDIDTTQGVSVGAESSTTPYQEHIACSYSYKIVSSVIPDFNRSIVWYRGEDAAEIFIHELQRKAEELCAEYIETAQEMEFSAENEVHFECAQVCHICQQILGDDDDRVRDHCHLTGTYRGGAHNVCNLNYRLKPKSWKLPVVMHNLKGYDGHLIIRALKREFGKVIVIPQNMEKDLSLTVGQLKIIDSFQFTPKSLDVLSKTLVDDEFKYLVETYTTSHLDLIRRKGVYPYDHMDSFERFEETQLPYQDAFCNKLSGDSCSDSDYVHAACI